jgi:hypothetical protein
MQYLWPFSETFYATPYGWELDSWQNLGGGSHGDPHLWSYRGSPWIFLCRNIPSQGCRWRYCGDLGNPAALLQVDTLKYQSAHLIRACSKLDEKGFCSVLAYEESDESRNQLPFRTVGEGRYKRNPTFVIKSDARGQENAKTAETILSSLKPPAPLGIVHGDTAIGQKLGEVLLDLRCGRGADYRHSAVPLYEAIWRSRYGGRAIKRFAAAVDIAYLVLIEPIAPTAPYAV